MTDQYAVIGHPISHSKSPWIHSQFAEQLRQAMTYSLLASPPDQFHDTVSTFISHGGAGLNVTVPFKQEAFSLADQLSEHATLAGAVNTLSFLTDGSIRGDNTDGVGLVRDLTRNQQISLRQKRVLVLGAGGAVRGVIQPLLGQGVSRLHVVNRTVETATQLAKLFVDCGPISAGSYHGLLMEGDFDVIINGTASSLSGELPPIPPGVVSPACHAYDMMYGAGQTVFERWCADQGAASTSGGLGMLVEQAAESFAIWRGTRPATEKVLASLSASLNCEGTNFSSVGNSSV